MHARRWVYPTFGHGGVQAALGIPNLRPLKVNIQSYVTYTSNTCPYTTYKLIKKHLPLLLIFCYHKIFYFLLIFSVTYMIGIIQPQPDLSAILNY
jgi:hypothetical protein